MDDIVLWQNYFRNFIKKAILQLSDFQLPHFQQFNYILELRRFHNDLFDFPP